jgi:hypothetical protein
MGVSGQRDDPAALPPRKTRYPLYRRLGGPQGRSGLVRKISLPPEFGPRTVQPVGSRIPTELSRPMLHVMIVIMCCYTEECFIVIFTHSFICRQLSVNPVEIICNYIMEMAYIKTRVELYLSGLIGTARHLDVQNIRIIGVFFEIRLHWQSEVRLLHFTVCTCV